MRGGFNTQLEACHRLNPKNVTASVALRGRKVLHRGPMLCCPMTTQIKNYPFEVLIAGPDPSAVLADQIKSLDWRTRRARRKGIVSAAEVADVRAKIRALIGCVKT